MASPDFRQTPLDAVIVATGLTRRFHRFVAVDAVSFSIRRGEIFGFLGPNGAGKSTTIRMLCGLLSSSAGTATVGGFDINRQPEQVRQTIGYMSQRFSLYKDLTVAENLTFFGGVYGLDRQRLRARLASVVETCELRGLETQFAGDLSGALQQRLALASAVLHEPPILFLDEPTSGVDPMSRRQFWDLIQGLAASGVTVLVTTHFMDEAEFCGRIGFIQAGRLIALDTPAAVKRAAVTEDVFQADVAGFRGAHERVAALDGVVTSAYFGATLHIFCRPGAYDAPALTRALGGLGLEPRAVARIPVSMEDAFIRLAAGAAPARPGEGAA